MDVFRKSLLPIKRLKVNRAMSLPRAIPARVTDLYFHKSLEMSIMIEISKMNFNEVQKRRTRWNSPKLPEM